MSRCFRGPPSTETSGQDIKNSESSRCAPCNNTGSMLPHSGRASRKGPWVLETEAAHESQEASVAVISVFIIAAYCITVPEAVKGKARGRSQLVW